MAVDIYLTIPGIPGESVAAGLSGAIQVQSFSWGNFQSSQSQQQRRDGERKGAVQRCFYRQEL